ncbi:MAG: hypothetical protein LBS99_06005 [Clostridiales bacterium]|jgi:hypothetical protein|nr:hypothetical protein [Clostridiales bacterium]
MARLESAVEQVAPSGQDRMKQRYEQFGWNLISVQDVVNNYESRSGDTIYQNKERWVKLMFQRDKDMPNYERVRALEKEWLDLGGISGPAAPVAPAPPKMRGRKKFVILSLPFTIIAIALAVASGGDATILVGAAIFLIPALIFWLLFFTKSKPYKKDNEARAEAYKAKLNLYRLNGEQLQQNLRRHKQIVEEAQRLI